MDKLLRAAVCGLAFFWLAALPTTALAQTHTVRVLVSERCWNESFAKARPMPRVDVKFKSLSGGHNDVIRESGGDGRALFQLSGSLFNISAKALDDNRATLEFVGHSGSRYNADAYSKMVEGFVLGRDVEMDREFEDSKFRLLQLRLGFEYIHFRRPAGEG